jgi:hypothetical protein
MKAAFLAILLVLCGCSKDSERRGAGRSLYNPQTVVSVQGTIDRVDLVSSNSGRWNGIHVVLNTGGEMIPVHIGPDWFLSDHQVHLHAGQSLEATGSKIVLQGQETIIASQITVDGATLTLRDENGFPVWGKCRR